MDYCSRWQEEKREHDHASSPGYSVSFPVPENDHNLSPRLFFSAGCVVSCLLSHAELYAVASNHTCGTHVMDPGTGTRLHTAKPGPVFANYLCLVIPDLLVIGIRPGCSSLSTAPKWL